MIHQQRAGVVDAFHFFGRPGFLSGQPETVGVMCSCECPMRLNDIRDGRRQVKSQPMEGFDDFVAGRRASAHGFYRVRVAVTRTVMALSLSDSTASARMGHQSYRKTSMGFHIATQPPISKLSRTIPAKPLSGCQV